MKEKKRIESAENLLKKWSLEALLIEDPIDLYYLTGKMLSFGKLLIEKNQSILFTDQRYFAEIQGKVPVKSEIYREDSFFTLLQKKEPLGFDSAKTSYALYQKMTEKSLKPVPIKNPLQSLRAIKDAEEISLLKKACAITYEGFLLLQKNVRTGKTEKDLAKQFERDIVDRGALSASFDPNVSFAENASFPHHHPAEKPLEKDAAILVDLGAKYQGYCADMTRVFFHGKDSSQTKYLYDLVIEAYEKALSYCKEGTPIADLDSAARESLAKHSMEKYFTHSLGHGVGLEIHEYPSIRQTSGKKDLLRAGMVITVEPGLYIDGEAGARFENTILVKKDGYENLFAS